MTVRLLIKWLQENFPQDALLVKTNSRAWFSCEVEEIRYQDLERMFFLKHNPQKNHKPVKKPCLVLHDENRCDY